MMKIVSINMPEYICVKKCKIIVKLCKIIVKIIVKVVKKILRKLFLEIEKNPPSLKKSYSGYNKYTYFSIFLIKKYKIKKLRLKNAYKKKLYLKKL